MAKCFVRFPQSGMRLAARSMLDADPERFMPFYPAANERVLVADLSDQERAAATANGAKIYEDVQFYPTANPLEFRGRSWDYWRPGQRRVAGEQPLLVGEAVATPVWQTKSLADVLDHIRAPAAWQKSRGKGVTIAVVDTGVASAMPEFPAAKRSPFSQCFAYATGPWVDHVGHGSMCASIAVGTSADGGRYDGVAPDAMLLSARSSLAATDIYRLYDWILARRRSGEIAGPIVVSNSYGLYTCSAPPGLPKDHPYLDIVREAIGEGIVVVFAAGNNHADVLCNHDPALCSPNTIWGVNSVDEVLSVGTVNWDEKMNVGAHGNSSRGPGQWSVAHRKPDCVAPTYGEVVWGAGYRAMEWWGTSGACPQVAGLAALLLSADPSLTPANVADIVRSSCVALPLAPTCAGAGRIDCRAAVDLVVP